jgi:two-component system, NarL family, sensor kinase
VVQAQADGTQVPEMTDVAARRFRLASPATATAFGALGLMLLGVTVALAALIHQLTILNVATGLTIPLLYAAVGVVVARHQPRNPVGWILIFFVVLLLIPLDAGYYAVLRYRLGYHGIPFGPAAVALASLLILAPALFPVVILLFPDGRLTSRRWRWVLWGTPAWSAIWGPSTSARRLPRMPVTTSASTPPATSRMPII